MRATLHPRTRAGLVLTAVLALILTGLAPASAGITGFGLISVTATVPAMAQGASSLPVDTRPVPVPVTVTSIPGHGGDLTLSSPAIPSDSAEQDLWPTQLRDQGYAGRLYFVNATSLVIDLPERTRAVSLAVQIGSPTTASRFLAGMVMSDGVPWALLTRETVEPRRLVAYTDEAFITEVSIKELTNPGIVFSELAVFSLYDYSGLEQPLDAAPAVNTVKASSSVPLRFGLGGDRAWTSSPAAPRPADPSTARPDRARGPRAHRLPRHQHPGLQPPHRALHLRVAHAQGLGRHLSRPRGHARRRHPGDRPPEVPLGADHPTGRAISRSRVPGWWGCGRPLPVRV